jgi:polysaccharide export outer membrane protein
MSRQCYNPAPAPLSSALDGSTNRSRYKVLAQAPAKSYCLPVGTLRDSAPCFEVSLHRSAGALRRTSLLIDQAHVIRFSGVLILLSVCISGVSSPAWAQSTPVAPTTSQIVLRPGDALRITVWRKPELSGQFTVSIDGTLAHPLFRAVTVAGVPLAVVETRLLHFLERYEEGPQFNLEPLLRVTVGGEVDRPNLYALGPETTVSQAVALAGGATDRGRSDRVRLVRQGRTMVIDLSKPEGSATQIPIQSGDEIFVDRKRAIFREYVTPFITIVGAAAAIMSAISRARQ